MYLGVDSSIGTSCVSKGDDARQLADPISVRTDERSSTVSIAGGVSLTASTDHVVSDVAREDRLAVSSRVKRDLDPLQVVGQEQTCRGSCLVFNIPAQGNLTYLPQWSVHIQWSYKSSPGESPHLRS